MSNVDGAALLDSGRTFFQAASGRWAGERMLRAMREGRPLSASELRTCDTLRKDEWVAFDEALIEEGAIRLKGIADLISAGLTIPISNALGKTMLEYEKVTDMEPAVVSLDGLARGDNDTQEFSLGSLPLPITHKDFNISIRRLSASRERGESIDTTQARTSGRLVAEKLELMLFRGGPTFGASTIYGYTNHPNRNTGSFTAGHWDDLTPATIGAGALADILKARAGLIADRMYGPYWVYVSSNFDGSLELDFNTSYSNKSVRQRLLEIDGVQKIQVVDQLPADTLIMVQATRDVVALVDGEGIQTIQWDIYGGMAVAFKAFAIQVPLIRADAQGRSGVYHMS